jgi:putative nucleotidyltransferase with HDIG domain
MWNHALATALVAEEVARATGAVDPHIVFLPGLFHDVGRIAFLLADDAAFGVIDAQVDASAKKRPDAERAWYGFDHAEAGAILAEDWGLVHEQVDAIRWHHQPAQADQGRLLAAVLNVGDAGAYVLGFGGSAVAPVDAGGREILLLSADAANEALATARSVFAIHHDLFG